MSTPQKGVKRALEFQSPPPSPSKKEMLVGYVLDVGEIQKGFYYSLTVQTSPNDVIRIACYKVELHSTMRQFADSGHAAKLEVYRNDDTGRVRFNAYCKIYDATATECNFHLNEQLKRDVQMEKKSNNTTVAALKKIDPIRNKNRFTITGRVSMGNEEPVPINTSYGPAAIKRDMYIEDKSGKINMQIFSNKLDCFQHGKSYKITSMTLNSFNHNIHVGLHRESIVTEVSDIKNLPTLVTDVRQQQLRIDGFNSVKNANVFFHCTGCKKEITIPTEIPKWLQCTTFGCDTQIKTAKLKIDGRVDVNFTKNDDEDVWATMFGPTLEKIKPGMKTAEEIADAVKDLEECSIVVDNTKIVDIIFDTKAPSDDA